MNIRIYISLVVLLTLFGCAGVCAQSADNRSFGFERRGDEDVPKNVLETREKMRIDKDKKEHTEMVERGVATLKLAERLERSYLANGRLSGVDLANLASVEKGIKKIRSDLGGDDDDDKADDLVDPDKKLTVADALSTLKATTATLVDELKKTSRFTISATAIQTSNTALKVARFLRLGK